jgi:flavin reductase (DIM6/NTAB) family NADH-FMN oxidoreductase RutF
MIQPQASKILDIRALRKSLGTFLTGVTVVTTLDEDGRPRGITANSFTSVSLEPPLVLVSVDRKAASYEAFRTSVGYVVHVLGTHQQDIAMKFASKDADKFAGHAWSPGSSGAPILEEVQAWIDCVVEQVIEIGDHILLIGRVQAFESSNQQPLGYHLGQFLTFDLESGALSQSERTLNVGLVIESETGTALALEGKGNQTYGLPRRRIPSRLISDSAVSAKASEVLGCEVTIPFLYSVFPQRRLNDELTLIYRGVIAPGQNPAVPDNIVFVDFQDIPWDRIADPTEASVLARYVREHENGDFGIYAGTELSGTVAIVRDHYKTPMNSSGSHSESEKL